MKSDSSAEFTWLGSREKHLDQPSVTAAGAVVVGCYGGNTHAGQYKNEDAALVWSTEDWEFAVLLDAHNSSESAELTLALLEENHDSIINILESPSLWSLNSFLVDFFSHTETRQKYAGVRGETACLIVARKGNFLYWLSIGDCVVYLLHPELGKMGQTALNQRQFYEWIGEQNTFDLPMLSFSSGIRQLRRGQNRILMVTDGLLEYPDSQFPDGSYFYEQFAASELQTNIQNALAKVHEARGRDSATIVGWDYECSEEGLMPTG